MGDCHAPGPSQGPCRRSERRGERAEDRPSRPLRWTRALRSAGRENVRGLRPMGEAGGGTARKRAGLARVLWTGLVMLFLPALAAPTGAFAGAGVTSQDRAATRALLEARYTYEQALLASAPASRAATEGLASSLGGECPGVLVGAPHETLSTLLASPLHSESPPQSPRQMGESNRERRQWSDLQG